MKRNLFAAVLVAATLYASPLLADLPTALQTTAKPSAPALTWKRVITLLAQKGIFQADNEAFLAEYFEFAYPDEYSRVKSNAMEVADAAQRHKSDFTETVPVQMSLGLTVRKGSYDPARKAIPLEWKKPTYALTANSAAFRGASHYAPNKLDITFPDGMPPGWQYLRLDDSATRQFLEETKGRDEVAVYIVASVSDYANKRVSMVPHQLWIYTTRQKDKLVGVLDVAGNPVDIKPADVSQITPAEVKEISAAQTPSTLNAPVTIGGDNSAATTTDAAPAAEVVAPNTESSEPWPADMPVPKMGFALLPPDAATLALGKPWVERASRAETSGGGIAASSCTIATAIQAERDRDRRLTMLREGLAAEAGCAKLGTADAARLAAVVSDSWLPPWEEIVPRMEPVTDLERFAPNFDAMSENERLDAVGLLVRNKKLATPLTFAGVAALLNNGNSKKQKGEIVALLAPGTQKGASIEDLREAYPKWKSRRSSLEAVVEGGLVARNLDIAKFAAFARDPARDSERHDLVMGLAANLPQPLTAASFKPVVMAFQSDKERRDLLEDMVKEGLIGMGEVRGFSDTISAGEFEKLQKAKPRKR